MPDFCCAPCPRNQLNINSYKFCKQITNTLEKRLLFELGALNFWLALVMNFARHEFAMILLNHSLSCTNELIHVATSCYCKMFFVEHYLGYLSESNCQGSRYPPSFWCCIFSRTGPWSQHSWQRRGGLQVPLEYGIKGTAGMQKQAENTTWGRNCA